MMNKRKVLVVAIGLLLVAAVGTMTFQLVRPIRIGVILPASSPLGNEENFYVRYYRDAHPRIGLRPVELVIENAASDESGVKAAYDRIAAQGVCAVVGGVLSQEGLWLSEKSAQWRIPTFGVTSSSSVLSGRKDAFFRIVATNEPQARRVSAYYESLGMKRLVLLTSPSNPAYAAPFVETIAKEFAGEVLEVPFASGDDLQKVLDLDPDSVFCILPAKDVFEVIRTLKDKAPGIRIGSSSWGSSEIINLYSSPLLDSVLLFEGSTEVVEGYREEIAAFERQYGLDATKGSHYAASVMHVLYDALRRVGSSRRALTSYFETPRAYESAYGTTTMDAYGDSSLQIFYILETQQGKVVDRIRLD